MYRIRVLTTQAEFAEYNRKFMAFGGSSPASDEWLDASTVVGVYQSGELVAGFVECSPPVRSVAQIPKVELMNLLSVYADDPSEIREVAAFWFDKTRKTATLRFLVWASFILRYTFLSRKKYVLGMANHDKIHQVYEYMYGQIIWDEPSAVTAGHRYKVYLWDRSVFLKIIARLVKACVRGKRRRKEENAPKAAEASREQSST